MIRRGEIYFVNLNPTKGREQRGRRPVLVVSVDAINSQPLVVAVVLSERNVIAHCPSEQRGDASPPAHSLVGSESCRD